MAKILTWRDEWTLHIETLDDDHREMVDRLLEIAHRFGEQQEPSGAADGTTEPDEEADENLYGALDRFCAFARAHFQREEELVRTIDYPGLPDHRSDHTILMAEFTAMVRELRERGVERLGAQDLDTLKDWVIAHILGTDRRFADHYFEICGKDTDRS